MSLVDMLYPKHYVVGEVYAKELIMEKAGDTVIGHAHGFDHLSLLAKGTVEVVADGVAVQYTGPTAVTILAGVHHKIIALTDDCLWYCIHSVPADLRGEALLDEVVVQRGQALQA